MKRLSYLLSSELFFFALSNASAARDRAHAGAEFSTTSLQPNGNPLRGTSSAVSGEDLCAITGTLQIEYDH